MGSANTSDCTPDQLADPQTLDKGGLYLIVVSPLGKYRALGG